MLLLAAEYGMTPVFRPPAPRAFAGAHLYNAYAGAGGRWLMANFHAHTGAWWGVTAGHGGTQELLDEYAKQGYDVAAVSNYQQITPNQGLNGCFIPCYEHGFSVPKVHQIVIDARTVDWLDFPLHLWFGQKQWLLLRLKSESSLVVLAHPGWHNAYTGDDMRKLCGYDGLEVISRYAPSYELWDAALSAGRAVWAFVGDDVHQLKTVGRFCMMIQPETPARGGAPGVESILDALKRGRAYAVDRGNGRVNDNALKRLDIAGNTIRLECAAAAQKIVFIGQDGQVKKTVNDASQATYDFQPDDTYIRTVVFSPKTTMYLNPVFRCDGDRPVRLMPGVNAAATWAKRAGTIIAVGAILGFVIRRRRRRGTGASA